MRLNTDIRINYNHLVLLAILILLTTILRFSLLILAPPLILFICVHFGFTFRRPIVTLLIVIACSWLISLLNGFYIKYNLLSLYYVIPFLLLLFAKPKYYFSKIDLFTAFMNILTGLMVANNIIGFIQYMQFPNDDSFAGIYGHFTVTQNGLSIINSILLYYHLRKFIYYKKMINLWLFILFSVSFIMGFYGGGILAMMGVLSLLALRLNTKKLIITALSGAIVIVLIGFAIHLIRPDTLRYNLNIISLFIGREGQPTPRKLLSYENYVKGYGSSVKDLVFGSGPGTFNSRSAFIIGSPDYFKMPGIFKSREKPFYFENYAYTLWNRNNTGRFQDGFMNQPFSSLLAFLGEYGLIFTTLLIIYYFNQHKTVTQYKTFSRNDTLAKDTYRYSSLLLVFLLIIDNYSEYPEITILILLLMKLAEMEMIKSANLNHTENA